MTTRIMKCTIHVGKKAMAYVWRSARDTGAWGIDPWGFKCCDCGIEWGGIEISSTTRFSDVSCSNCYSDKVLLTAVRLDIPGAEDFEDRT